MESYLLDGELILAQAGDLYASDRRLIRYKRFFKGEEFDDIPYCHITSIGIVRNKRRGFFKAGMIIVTIGFFALLTLLSAKPFLESTSELWGNMAGNMAGNAVIQGIPFIGMDLVSLLAPLIPLSIIILVMGFSLIGLGFFLPQVYVQFRATGLTSDTESKFRLGDIRREATLNLVRIVRLQSIDREPELAAYYRQEMTESRNYLK